MIYIIPAIIFVAVVGSLLKAMFGKLPGAALTGVLGGLAAWFLLGLGIAAIAAFVMFILSLTNVQNWSSGGGEFSSGGSSGGSSSWGGGGGSFGGGGSSGSW